MHEYVRMYVCVYVCLCLCVMYICVPFVYRKFSRRESKDVLVPPSFVSGLFAGAGDHTYVESDCVRYVYQPLESLYLVLLTTKKSNILEDLQTLRVFATIVQVSTI